MDDEIMQAYTLIFEGLEHLGPGDAAITRNLLERLKPDLPAKPRVADLGCGVGASALVLAQSLPGAQLLALDTHPPFIDRLASSAESRGLAERVSAVVGDMAEPPPLAGKAGEFDLIWSESSIYSIGRGNALARWRPLLKPGGWLVFSDIVWHAEASARSGKSTAFWSREYPDITTAEVVVQELLGAGFDPLDPVPADRQCWSNYYEPLRQRLHRLKRQRQHPRALVEVIADFEREIDVFDGSGDDVALFFFLARRAD